MVTNYKHTEIEFSQTKKCKSLRASIRRKKIKKKKKTIKSSCRRNDVRLASNARVEADIKPAGCPE